MSPAAPGVLAESPLFLTNAVEPNILFLIDDSGSMDWGLMTQEENGLIWLGCRYEYAHPAADNEDTWVVPSEEGLIAQGIAAPYGGVWRAWNRDYNRAYYDSSVRYLPWPGEDSAGNPYVNASPTAAPLDPYVPATGTLDLTAELTYQTDYCEGGLGLFDVTNFYPARYYTWTDSNTNGAVDIDDGHTLVEIRPATATYAGGPERLDCANPTACTYAEEIQNFANWFSYYRRRELVAKAAYGQVISDASNARMGMVTLHNNGTVNTAIETMNADPRTGAKKTLLDSLYSMTSDGGTPLRNALNESGEYLGCESNDFFGSCPAAPANDGGECQQNFTLMMTDGFYNGAFGGGIGNADGDNNTEWDSGTAGPYGDAESDTLADIAMKYYEEDLRPGVDDLLAPPPSGIDENKAQHVVTYSVAFGVDGTLTTMPASTTAPFAWPAPTTDPARIDDLRHAAWNGRGEFLSAQNPEELINGLRGALTSIQSRTGSSSSVAFNTGSLSTNSQLYLALFNSERWSGDLLAYNLDPNSGNITAVPAWSAGTQLTARNLQTAPRTILTYDGDDGIPLRWASLTAAQKADLRTNPSGAVDNEATGMARLGYLRGDRACERASGGSCYYDDGSDVYTDKALRVRASRLGDIVHSGPVFAGAPESDWPDVPPFPSSAGRTYSEFRDAKSGRPGIVYVGGNDGMLHALEQPTGRELFAYVPETLFSTDTADGLHYLTDPAYTHRYKVDLTATLADAYVRTTPTGSDSWKTILVGGLRGGGRGLFALDVTDPSAVSELATAAANTVLWEFSSSDDPDLGHTFSRPSIVPLEGPGNSIRWAAIFGNGYNDLGSGEAKLFILFLEAGLDGTWTPGTDYLEISTEVGTAANRNGLSTPAVIDSNGDGLADRVYAGDLRGNMWAFDLSGSNPSSWDVDYQNGASPAPLYSGPAGQPITAAPVIVRNSNAVPSTAFNQPNTLVIFGTGQYLTVADITTTTLQSMIGVWDSGTPNVSRGDLVAQFIGMGSSPDGTVGRTLTTNPVDYSVSKGWYIDLPDPGERQVTDAVIRGNLVFFNTITPDSNPCEAGGTSWLMVAEWETGGAPPEVAFDINNDFAIDDLDTINDESAAGIQVTGIAASPVNLANKRYTSTTQTTGGSTIEVTEIIDLGGPRTGRLSWEELNR
ncbi:MAG: PilC/PilY family type IV pilus protein [Pseudomonadota bacterium]